MPVLEVADVTRSEAFYCEKLGFRSHGAWGAAPSRQERRAPLTVIRHHAVLVSME